MDRGGTGWMKIMGRRGQWNEKQEGSKGGIWVSEMVDRNFSINSGFIQDLKTNHL